MAIEKATLSTWTLEVRTGCMDHELGMSKKSHCLAPPLSLSRYYRPFLLDWKWISFRYSKPLYCIKHLRGTGIFAMEQLLKACNKNVKNSESRKSVSTPCNTISKKKSRNGENPTRFKLTTEKSSDFSSPTTWLCRNSACRAVLSIDVAFCRRCSCCICHQYDDNKDPSLWLVCESESGQVDSCGGSCHIECAFQRKRLGVVNLGKYLHLDGSYCCAACGKVSGILGCWKKQLALAKDARRADVLHFRLNLCYRLLNGTSKFKFLHNIIMDAKTKLEEVVAPMIGDSVIMARSIVDRLDSAVDVQKLCSHEIDKANELLANYSTMSLNGKGDSLPAACRFLFEEVTSSSLVIVLIDIPTPIVDSIVGYKLWFCKSQDELFSNEPLSTFRREKRRISVKHLQPCTEHTFRIIAYTEAGDLGHSEAKCFTKSVEVLNKKPSSAGFKKDNPSLKDLPNSNLGGSCSSFKVRDLGKYLHLAWAQEQGCEVTRYDMPLEIRQPPPVSREIDLNVVPIPDLNDLPPSLESSSDEDNEWTREHAYGPDDATASHGVEKNGLGLAKSNGSGPNDYSQAWFPNRNRDVLDVDSLAKTHRKRASSVNEEIPVNGNALVNGSPVRVSSGPDSLGGNFDYFLQAISSLESQGYIKQDFREKMSRWFWISSTEEERQVVNTLIRSLVKDPNILAGQLVDTLRYLSSSKRPRI